MPDHPLADEVVARLRATYQEAADPARARSAEAYLRDQFPFLGLPTPERRRRTKAALADLPAPTEAELAAVARALWAQPEREFQHAGCDYVRDHVRVAGPGFADVLRELVTTKPWWDTVDLLAAHGAGPLVRDHPELGAVMDEWVGDGHLWVARTAVLHQLTYKERTDEGRLFAHCRRRAEDREFFLRKAIGWALRSYAAVAPAAVEGFVEATPTLSPLSVREAMKGVRRAQAKIVG